MILDLADVAMFDLTVGLALENAIKDAQEADNDFVSQEEQTRLITKVVEKIIALVRR